MQAGISTQAGVMDYAGIGGRFDVERTFLPAGQSAGLVHDIKPAGEILADIVREAEAVIDRTFAGHVPAK
jgi:enoyl-[acyl-carrier protein] reductase II